MELGTGELAEARRPRDDLAHLIRSDFVAAEPEKFTRDVLNLAHAQVPAPSAGCRRPSGRRPSILKVRRRCSDAAIAASAPGIVSIRAWTLSEGPSLRRKPRIMPTVFSATALSMPALAASCPISSSIFAPPSARSLPDPSSSEFNLERLRCELQAMTTFEAEFASADRPPSVAAMQDRLRISQRIAPNRRLPATFGARVRAGSISMRPFRCTFKGAV